jgi:hypothetical protein
MDIDRDRLNHAARHPRAVDRPALDSLAAVLASTRRLEDEIGAAPVYRAARHHLALATVFADDARGTIRRDAVDLAGQWSQYTGWIHIALGDYAGAALLFGQALKASMDAEDDDLAATVWSWKAHLAWMLGYAGPTIGMSRHARKYRNIYAGQVAYDALQEARGHAVRGDTSEVDRLVDESHDLAEQAVRDLPGAAPWHYYRSPGFWDLERGRALSRLPSHAGQAVTYLQAGLDALPDGQGESEWVMDYRADLEHAQALCG